MLDYRSTIAAAAWVGALLVGCTAPDLPTDLRTSGPPNVTTVTVMSDLETEIDPSPVGIGRYVEEATYCRLNDKKRPGKVGLSDIRTIQVCPEDLTKPAPNAGEAEAVPPAWFVRVVFDELLDPTIEELGEDPSGGPFGTIENTHPVALQCNGTDIPYGGYYVPNGNRQSWPLGPALYIQPNKPMSVPTGATCTVTLADKIHNKDGESVPADQRDYQFKIAPMALRFSDPDPGDVVDPGASVVAVDTPLEFFFTAPLKDTGTRSGPDADPLHPIVLSTLDTTKVKISSGPNLASTTEDGKANPEVCAGNGTAVDPTQVRAYLRGMTATTTQLVLRIDLGGSGVAPEAGWAPKTTYLVEFADGATVEPSQGGDPAVLPGPSDYSLCFHTPAS